MSADYLLFHDSSIRVAHTQYRLVNNAPLLVIRKGASCLAQALRANTALTELDLRWNEMGNDGARAIRDGLDTNRSLSSLKLSGNKARHGSGGSAAVSIRYRRPGRTLGGTGQLRVMPLSFCVRLLQGQINENIAREGGT